MAPIKRAAPAPVAVGVNFFDDEMYAGGGFNLPEADYALLFDVRMHAYTKKNGTKGMENLGVLVTAYPLLESPEGVSFGEPLEQFYSMGGKAKLSFAPNPDTGKGLVAIPNAPSTTLPRMTNWDTLRSNLLNCAPELKGIMSNDFSVLDGVWVHIQSMKAPEERKSFGAKTGEAEDEPRNDMISVPTEVLPDGKPWEGTGGLPADAAPAAPAPVAAAPVRRAGVARAVAPVAAAPAARTAAPRGRAAVAPAPAAEEEGVDEAAVLDAAQTALSTVLTKKENANGMKKILLRTGAFKAITDADMAQAVMDTHFADDAALNAVLGELGYKIAGIEVVPA